MSNLPHFIIIGAMKAATSSLQEQLARQPGIFMSDPKEPNYFSDDDQYARGDAWYSGLFAEAPDGCLLGEASTHYTKLPTYPHTIERLQKQLPHARFIYVMRHPVERLISHYIHEWSMGVYRCSIDEAVEQYQELIVYGQYALQLEPYFKAFGRDAVLPVFFDQLVHESQAELERICKFIGYEGSPQWSEERQPSNVSSKRIRRFPLYAMLVDSSIATWLRRRLIPRKLRDAVKARMRMQDRPELSEETRASLEEVFDQDLQRLGEWLGVELNCRNYKEVTALNSLNWVEIDER
jgi:hypothetical protein